MFILILFGPPGAGKGTQAAKIAGEFDWVHISTGDILRAEVSQGTPLGLKVKAVMDAGHLVSDDLLIEIMKSVFQKHDNAKGFVLDGFPRTINQASELDRMLQKLGHNVSMVLALDVNEEELVKRLLNRAIEQGRVDDSEEIVRHRLRQYHQHTKPVIDYYSSRNIFQVVQGIGGIDDIFQTLCNQIRPLK